MILSEFGVYKLKICPDNKRKWILSEVILSVYKCITLIEIGKWILSLHGIKRVMILTEMILNGFICNIIL